MNLQSIKEQFRTKVSDKIEIKEEGLDRFRIFTPFLFDDGDHLSIVLKKIGEKWLLSDEGHTYMHLSYSMDIKDLEKGERQKLIDNTLSYFQITNSFGQLVLEFQGDEFGDALYNYVQGLLKVVDVTYLSRDRVRSTFMEDFKRFIASKVPEDRLVFNYNNEVHDPKHKYPVDCKVNGMARPLFIFGISNDNKCRDVTISILQFERWGEPFFPISIFEDQEMISRNVLSRFSDVVEKQFSSLDSSKERIAKYLEENVK